MPKKDTTLSVRLDQNKKSRLDEILDAIGLSRQEALEEGIDHIIERFGILADVTPSDLEKTTESIIQELQEEGVVKGEIGIEAIPLPHKLLLISNFLQWSLKTHEDEVKIIHSKHAEEYRRTPDIARLVPLNPFDVQELQNGGITRPIELPAEELYHHPDRVMGAAKIRHIVLIVQELTTEIGPSGFLKAAKSNYNSNISGVKIIDKELDIRSTQNLQENSMEVRIRLPFRPFEE